MILFSSLSHFFIGSSLAQLSHLKQGSDFGFKFNVEEELELIKWIPYTGILSL